jgi:hypothetical protein
MTREEHDKYVDHVRSLMDRFTKDRLEDLALTDEEALALAELDPKYFEMMENALSKFTPAHPEYDYMRVVMEKALAVFVLEVLPTVEEAYRYGVETEL